MARRPSTPVRRRRASPAAAEKQGGKSRPVFSLKPGSELQGTLDAVTKRYGAAVHRTANQIRQPGRISTGSFMLDFCLLGGIPLGRISHLIGAKHSGKTMLSNMIVGNAQRQFPDKTPAIIDVEKTFEGVWAQKLGVDISTLQVFESDTGEMAVDMADALLQTEEVSLIVVDSLAAMSPSKELDDSAEDAHIGLQSRLIGRLCRKLNSGLAKERMRGHEISVLFINQFRTKIGVMHGDPRTAPGGWAVEHFPSVDIRLRNKETVGKDMDDVDAVLSNEHNFTVTKNKLNNGPRSGEFRMSRTEQPALSLREGSVDDSKTILTYAKKFGLFGGGGTKWTLEFSDDKWVWGSQQEGVVYLNGNKPVRDALAQTLIQHQAMRQGMPVDFLGSFLVHPSDHE